MSNNTLIIFVILGIFIHLGGWVFAIQIYHTPTEPGWTWSSVGTGTWMIAISEIIALILLYHFNLLEPLYLIIVPISALALLGIPMAAAQIYKKWRANKKINKINTEHDFTR